MTSKGHRYVIFTLSESGKRIGKYLISKGHSVTFFISSSDIQTIDELGFGTLKDHLFFYHSLSDSRVISALNDAPPDYILSATFNQKLSQSIINTARINAFNFHPSLLPKYRGPYPQFYVIKNGDTHTGLSVHTLTEKWDSGDIVAQLSFEVRPTETASSLNIQTENGIPHLMDQLYPKLQSETFDTTPQTGSDYYPRPSMADTKINWSQSAITCETLIRAGNCFYPAHTNFKGTTIKIHESRITTQSISSGHFKIDGHQLLIGTADHALAIECIETRYGLYSTQQFLSKFNFSDGQSGSLN